MDDLATFRKACRKWAKRLGLDDWRLIVERGPKEADPPTARAFNDVDSRVARVHWFKRSTLTIDQVAKHELLHTLLADWASAVTRCRSDEHADAVREEHRLIEKLMSLIPD